MNNSPTPRFYDKRECDACDLCNGGPAGIYRCPACAVSHLEREVAELREALGSLQELLAKQIAVPEGDDILCAACGLANDAHTERCPVARGLAIIDAALKPHAQGSSE